MEEKDPLVSIIIPVYNQKEEWLKEAIESAIRQTYKNWELIIVDDGSKKELNLHNVTELVGDEIRGYGIKVIRQENKGVAGALNTGIKNMKGEYFAWLSSDDMWYPEKLEKQMSFIKNNPDAKIVYSDWEYIDASGRHVRYEVEPTFESLKDLQFHLCHRFFGCGSATLIKADCFEKVGTFNEKYRGMEDYEMWFRLAKEYMFYKIPEVLMKYRDHHNALRYNFPNFDWTFKEIRNNGRELLNYNKFKITAVVIGKNVQNTIQKCVTRIRENPKVDEIIVINDGSKDKTQQKLTQVMPFMKEISYEVIMNLNSVGRGKARNIGLKKAKNQLILSVDGDIIPEAGFINRLLKVMDGDPFLDIVAGSLKWKSTNMGVWGEYYDFNITQTAKKQIGTALTLFKKSALKKVNYLDETMKSGEDSEMFFRLQKEKVRFAKISDLLGTHIEDRTLYEVLARHYQYGIDRFEMYKRHKGEMQGQFKIEELRVHPPEILNMIQNLTSVIGSLGFRDAANYGHTSVEGDKK